MTKAIRIDPDGTITRLSDTDVSALAHAEFGDDCSVELLAEPSRAFGLLVGWIHDWGIREGLPLNRKAWACYGRSPIYGPMFVCHDSDDSGLPHDRPGRPDLPEGFIGALEGDDLLDEDVMARMDDFLVAHPEFPVR